MAGFQDRAPAVQDPKQAVGGDIVAHRTEIAGAIGIALPTSLFVTLILGHEAPVDIE